MKDWTKALERYAQDNAQQGGRIVEVTVTEDMDLDVMWTDATWEDGVPVTKYFGRNPEISLHLPKGTVLKGVTYTGRSSGSTIFDFPYGKMWYSVAYAENVFDL